MSKIRHLFKIPSGKYFSDYKIPEMNLEDKSRIQLIQVKNVLLSHLTVGYQLLRHPASIYYVLQLQHIKYTV